MYRLLLKYGKEPPEYRLFPEALTLVLYNPELDEAFVREIAEAQERLGGFSLDHLIAVGYLRRVGEAGLEELARALQLPEEAARRVLSRMERMGLLRKEEGGTTWPGGTFWRSGPSPSWRRPGAARRWSGSSGFPAKGPGASPPPHPGGPGGEGGPGAATRYRRR